MLDIAFGLIGEVTSNSLLMFCFCNFIIVIILTGSSKSASMESQDSTFVTSSMSFNASNIASHDYDCGDDEEMIVTDVSSAQDESLIDVSDEDEVRESTQCCDDHDDEEEEYENDDDDYDDDDDDDDVDDEEEKEEYENDVDDDDDDDDDDDLRKRAEEFIAKINNEWRQEKLRALNLVY